jgi:uncharacterized protein YndB with AHSA1/START domain
MTVVAATIVIDAPPETVYDVMLDPARLHEWVTIHRRVDRVDAGAPRHGYEMDQVLNLRHVDFKVHWTLTRADRPLAATWEGHGPAGSYARTAYLLERTKSDGTRFMYENEFRPPGGFIGLAASHVIVGGVPEREANRSLRNLKTLIEG